MNITAIVLALLLAAFVGVAAGAAAEVRKEAVQMPSIEEKKVNDYVEQSRRKAVEELELIRTGKKPYLTPDQWRPVAYAAQAPATGVTLDGGPLRICFDRNISYLNKWFELKKQYREATGDIGWEKHLPASSEGRMLGGAAHTLRWGEREDMRRIVDALVGVVKKRQREDGYCLPYDEKLMEGSGNAWFDERRNYDRVGLTRGMVAASMVGNRDALAVMRKFYDWLYASPYCAGLLAGPFDNGSSHNCNNGHEGSLLMYFSPVGKPEDLVAVERCFVQDFFIEASRRAEPLSLAYYPFHVPHSYVLLAYQAWLDHYRGTGASKYLEAAQGAWRIVHDHYLHIGGTLAICEHKAGSYPPDSYYLHVNKEHHTGETCGSVFWADFNHRLLQFAPDEERYAGEIEKVVLNVILAAQDKDGSIRYHNRLQGNKDRPQCVNTCCEVMSSPFIARLPQYLYSIAGDGLYVNMFAPSAITWQQDGRPITLTVSTDFPCDGRVNAVVAADAPVKAKLRVRVPAWAAGPVTIQVNGAPAAAGEPGRYVVLDRTWRGGDQIHWELPMAFQLTRYAGCDRDPRYERYAVEYGPTLMALVGGADLDIAADQLARRLSPIPGKPLHFAVENHPGLTYLPYWHLEAEAFTCFPTLR